jgi:hypothetical protein
MRRIEMFYDEATFIEEQPLPQLESIPGRVSARSELLAAGRRYE